MLANKQILRLSILQLFVLMLLLIGCASKIPQSLNDNSSALSISVGLSSRASMLNKESINTNKVFFIRLDDENDSLKKQQIIKSNYNKEPVMVSFQMDNIDSFCFNLEPGTYAAIASTGVGANSGVRYFIYFPEEMIRKTVVNLKENSIIYLGEFDFEDVSYTNQMKDADEFQLYYFNSGLIDGVSGPNKPQKISWHRNPQHHSPSLMKFSNGKDEEIKFLTSIQGSFKNTEWQDNIRERLNSLNR